MKKNSKIYIAGHRGLVGSAIYRTLVKAGHTNFCLATSAELDLRDSNAVNNFFLEHEPEYVFVAAAKVGGILANKNYPVDFLHENLMIQTNIIEASFRFNVEKLLFL